MNVVLLDTGPLVAILNRNDKFHGWARERFAELTPPLLTCEGVIAEASYLLRDLESDRHPVIRMIELKRIQSPFRIDEEAGTVGRLLQKYSDLPMDFADACLVRMSEQYSDSRVFTLDHDFPVYRRHGRQAIPLIFPDRR
jgi:predicted nucleic acid-binding protein